MYLLTAIDKNQPIGFQKLHKWESWAIEQQERLLLNRLNTYLKEEDQIKKGDIQLHLIKKILWLLNDDYDVKIQEVDYEKFSEQINRDFTN